MTELNRFSKDLSELVRNAASRIALVGGEDIPARTGIFYTPQLILTFAREAESGDKVPVLLPGGAATQAEVKAYDSFSELAILELKQAGAAAWVPRAERPLVGSLAVTVAYPSPEGPEARLEMIRCVGGPTKLSGGAQADYYLQTDSPAFPGFEGAAVVDPEGALLGINAENRAGNGGFVIPAPVLWTMAETGLREGFRETGYLGLRTLEAELPGEPGRGLLITEADPEGPAGRAGLRAGDFLLSLGGMAMGTPGELWQWLSQNRPGQPYDAVVLRGGARLTLHLTPAGHRETVSRRWGGRPWRGPKSR